MYYPFSIYNFSDLQYDKEQLPPKKKLGRPRKKSSVIPQQNVGEAVNVNKLDQKEAVAKQNVQEVKNLDKVTPKAMDLKDNVEEEKSAKVLKLRKI